MRKASSAQRIISSSLFILFSMRREISYEGLYEACEDIRSEGSRKSSFLVPVKEDDVTGCSWRKRALAEFIGCAVMCLIGDAAVASGVTSPKDTGYYKNQVQESLAWGIAVMIGILLSERTSGAHLNPSVTISQWFTGKISYRMALIYILAQVLGFFFGSLIVLACFANALDNFDGGHRQGRGDQESISVFSTEPQPYLTITETLLDQLVSTTLLIFIVLFCQDEHLYPFPERTQGIFIGLVIVGLVMSLSVNSGLPLNPARDFAPRLMMWMFGWGNSVFLYAQARYWWIPIIAPSISGILGSVLFHLFKMVQ